MSALETRTFRADNLEEVLGTVREQLGPAAIVVRQREGIIGGIGGFFGKRCVEVDVELPATQPKPSAMPPRAITNAYAANAPATAPESDPFSFDDFEDDGGDLFQSLIGDTSVFASTLAGALESSEPAVYAAPAPGAHDFEPLLTDFEPIAAPASPPAAPERFASTVAELFEPALAGMDEVELFETAIAVPGHAKAVVPVEPVSSLVAASSNVSIAAALTRAGLDQRLAESLVAEAEQQFRVFDPDEPLEDQVRQALVGRISTKRLNGRYRRRVIVLVGEPGSGKTSAAARLCAAHAAGGKRVVALSLEPVRKTLELGRQTEGLDVELVSADQPGLIEFALARMAKAEIVVVDTPGVRAHDEAGWAKLAMLLRPIAANETHLLLPGSLDATEIDAQLGAASENLAVDRLMLTHLDRSAQAPGPAVAASIRAGIAISATATATRLVPADPYKLAALILP
ncbi:MAG TPA: AAA family ATPase [Gaiellaceae bacterium]